MNLLDNEAFYGACADALGIRHDYVEPVPRRNRWNTRRLGNGRFPGFGLVRAYSSCVIVTSRRGTKKFSDRAAVLEWLRDYKTRSSTATDGDGARV